MARCAKVRYPDKLGAKIALASTQASEAQHRKQVSRRAEVRAYRCPDCKGWHLTSRKERP